VIASQRSLPALLNSWSKDLAPAYFSLVMATGVLSLTFAAFGRQVLAFVLFAINVLFYVWLCLLTLWRLRYFRRFLYADFLDFQKGPGFFTLVAGSAILGSQLVVLFSNYYMATALWLLGMILWFILTYGMFSAFTIRLQKPTLEIGITGTWLLAVVATQSLATLAVLLAAEWSPLQRLEFNFVALSLWLWGGMFYIWIVVLIFYRYTFFKFDAEDLVPPYWINMGAMAISTLTGALLIDNGQEAPYLHSLLPFLKGFTVFYWATGSWWIPLLVVLEVWRHGVQRQPIHYSPLYWGMVFPLAMYSLSTRRLAASMGLPFLQPLALIFFALACVAWVLVLAGMIRQASQH